jgi:hypothetical protein
MRITPTLAFLMIVYLAIFELVVQRFPYVFYNDLMEPCTHFWWSTLLHVQNEVNPEKMVDEAVH